MGAPAVPPPEPGAIRLYYRDDRNVSIPFAWASHDFQLIALDEGELLVRARQKRVRRRKEMTLLNLGNDLFSRMVGWWLHCMNANDEKPGAEFHRLLGLNQPRRNAEPPSDETIHDWVAALPNSSDDEFVRSIR